MRAIKFRAWEGTMMLPVSGLYSSNKDYDLSKGDVETCAGIDDVFGMIPNDPPVMQFTGLLDKNGVEIYEGDIVHIVGLGNIEMEFPFLDLWESYPEGDIGAILGNIYENQEILEN